MNNKSPFIASSFTNKNFMNNLNENVNEAIKIAKQRTYKLEIKDMVILLKKTF